MVDEAGSVPFIPGLARTVGQLHMRRGDADLAVRWYRSEASWRDGAESDDRLTPETRIALAAALRATGDAAGAAGNGDGALAMARARGMPRLVADALDQTSGRPVVLLLRSCHVAVRGSKKPGVSTPSPFQSPATSIPGGSDGWLGSDAPARATPAPAASSDPTATAATRRAVLRRRMARTSWMFMSDSPSETRTGSRTAVPRWFFGQRRTGR
jgi:hypothetical protein